LSLGYWLEGRKLERAERELARCYDLNTCATSAEVDTLRALDGTVAADWFPNGVDADYFQPTADPYDANRICFIGRMDYFPNEQAVLRFVQDVLPAVRARRPATTLFVVGAAPSAALRALHGKDGVHVTGTVDDVRPYVRGAALTIAPLTIARGTQNKILESMAMGVPVVASTIAARGVDAEVGTDLLAADSPNELADAVLAVLEQPRKRAHLAEAGRARALSHHSWTAAMQRMDELVRACMSRPRAARPAPA
jgi:sugar transferase (PEP-CTERM/EpsH1 system associated)